MTSPSVRTPTSTDQPLAEAIAALAETPDDVPGLDGHLQRVAQLAVDRIAAVDYAAISQRQDGASCFVAASGELIDAVEDVSSAVAQPQAPISAAGGTATMTWPDFPETAAAMGMRVVSVPLFTGSGASVAMLDLYSRDAGTIRAITTGICAAYDPDLPLPAGSDDAAALDAGGEELLAGFAEALSVRATIQLALAMIGKTEPDGTGEAYPQLRLHAAGQGVSLLNAANDIVLRSFGA